MIWIAIAAVYLVGIIITATLLSLQIKDHPGWALNTRSNTGEVDRVMVCIAASLFWPVTLLVVATVKARARWLQREIEA